MLRYSEYFPQAMFEHSNDGTFLNIKREEIVTCSNISRTEYGDQCVTELISGTMVENEDIKPNLRHDMYEKCSNQSYIPRIILDEDDIDTFSSDEYFPQIEVDDQDTKPSLNQPGIENYTTQLNRCQNILVHENIRISSHLLEEEYFQNSADKDKDNAPCFSHSVKGENSETLQNNPEIVVVNKNNVTPYERNPVLQEHVREKNSFKVVEEAKIIPIASHSAIQTIETKPSDYCVFNENLDHTTNEIGYTGQNAQYQDDFTKLSTLNEDTENTIQKVTSEGTMKRKAEKRVINSLHKQSNSSKSRKYKIKLSDLQVTALENEFNANSYITGIRRASLAKTLNLTDHCIKMWFQNKRNNLKKRVCGSTSSYSTYMSSSDASISDSAPGSYEENTKEYLSHSCHIPTMSACIPSTHYFSNSFHDLNNSFNDFQIDSNIFIPTNNYIPVYCAWQYDQDSVLCGFYNSASYWYGLLPSEGNIQSSYNPSYRCEVLNSNGIQN